MLIKKRKFSSWNSWEFPEFREKVGWRIIFEEAVKNFPYSYKKVLLIKLNWHNSSYSSVVGVNNWLKNWTVEIFVNYKGLVGWVSSFTRIFSQKVKATVRNCRSDKFGLVFFIRKQFIRKPELNYQKFKKPEGWNKLRNTFLNSVIFLFNKVSEIRNGLGI